MTNGQHTVIVVGGGAAGLMAAGTAAEAGARVLVLEKMGRTALKLGITGKGRCNLTNTAELTEFLARFGKNGRFLRHAFSQFFSDELVAFLEAIGIKTALERGGRVFPAGNEALQVVRALRDWAEQSGVRTRCRAAVTELVMDGQRVTGVRLGRGDSSRQEDELINADAVILAAGGSSYPVTGSSGDGAALAQAAGHQVTPLLPALVPLETEGPVAKKLQGLSLRNVSLDVYLDGRKCEEHFGEMLFTHFGVSGPIILSASRRIVPSLEEGRKVTLAIDLKPALDHDKLDKRLLRDIDAHGKQHAHNLLKGLLPRLLIPVCHEMTGLEPDAPAHQINAKDRKRLRIWLKDFRLKVTGHRGFAEAIVTAGGVDLREVDPKSMESRKVKGLFIAGEVLDLDGDTGGYNLQAAFSTGRLAGVSAAAAPDQLPT